METGGILILLGLLLLNRPPLFTIIEPNTEPYRYLITREKNLKKQQRLHLQNKSFE